MSISLLSVPPQKSSQTKNSRKLISFSSYPYFTVLNHFREGKCDRLRNRANILMTKQCPVVLSNMSHVNGTVKVDGIIFFSRMGSIISREAFSLLQNSPSALTLCLLLQVREGKMFKNGHIKI